MRRALLLVTAIATLVEGVAIAVFLAFLGSLVGASSMSLNGSSPAAVRVVLWVLAGLVLLGVVAVTVVLLRSRRRAVLIAAATVQWVLTVAAGVVSHGWAFVYALAVCGLYLGVLFGEPERAPGSPRPLSR